MRILHFVLLTSATAALLTRILLFAEDFPKRKSGLWDIKTSSPAAKDEIRGMQLCVDQKMDDLTGQAAARAKKMCSKTDIHRESGRLTVDSVCKFGPTTA